MPNSGRKGADTQLKRCLELGTFGTSSRSVSRWKPRRLEDLSVQLFPLLLEAEKKLSQLSRPRRAKILDGLHELVVVVPWVGVADLQP